MWYFHYKIGNTHENSQIVVLQNKRLKCMIKPFLAVQLSLRGWVEGCGQEHPDGVGPVEGVWGRWRVWRAAGVGVDYRDIDTAPWSVLAGLILWHNLCNYNPDHSLAGIQPLIGIWRGMCTGQVRLHPYTHPTPLYTHALASPPPVCGRSEAYPPPRDWNQLCNDRLIGVVGKWGFNYDTASIGFGRT